MAKSIDRRNQYSFSLGTIGRDMLYSLVSMYLIFYLTDIVQLSNQTLWWITGLMLAYRIFDACNDPVMGVIVDNTRSRFGKFKPWIAIGMVFSSVFTVLLFTDFGLSGSRFVVFFAVVYLFWGISFTANDIAYWSLMPALTTEQTMREKIGATARICANLGLFAVVVGIVPITSALGEALNSMKQAYFVFALIIATLMIAGQIVTLVGVKEPRSMFREEEKTKLRDMVKIIFKNDQLLYTAVSMALFMIGYVTTTSFGLYFFKYAYRNEDMYAIFALILGVSQIIALAIFPLFRKRFTRKTLYSAAMALVGLGYILFFFSPMNMVFIGAAGILVFLGQAFIQLLMLVFLADTIEYGQWKLGRRNNSITLSLQPFINKIGGAAASGIVGVTLILSGINEAKTPADVSSEGLFMMKAAMFILPLISIAAGYLVYRTKYKIDKEFYDNIVADLKERGDIKSNE